MASKPFFPSRASGPGVDPAARAAGAPWPPRAGWPWGRIAVLAVFGGWCAGCASISSGMSSVSNNIADLPAPVGLPEGTPARPAMAPEYLPVNDIPKPRDVKLLSEEERRKLQEDLARARARQGGRAPAKEAGE